MAKVSKKRSKSQEDVAQKGALMGVQEGLQELIGASHAKFDETVDVAVVLGIDASKGEQSVRGSVSYPHGLGKTTKVVAFVKGEHEDAAKAAGADYVGAEDLVEKIGKEGWTDFDAAVTTPDMMALVSKTARVLGPRGLLPNKKVGTVTFDVASVIKELKQGRASFRNDKGGIVHVPFGKVSFGVEKLADNLRSVISALVSSKPPTSKGKFLKKVVISSTMGKGIGLNPDEIL